MEARIKKEQELNQVQWKQAVKEEKAAAKKAARAAAVDKVDTVGATATHTAAMRVAMQQPRAPGPRCPIPRLLMLAWSASSRLSLFMVFRQLKPHA